MVIALIYFSIWPTAPTERNKRSGELQMKPNRKLRKVLNHVGPKSLANFSILKVLEWGL